MDYRMYTYMQGGTMKNVLINFDSIGDAEAEGETIPQYFVGEDIVQVYQHADVHMESTEEHMLSDIYISD